MSIFPTTILLATDGSKEAQLAASTAAHLAQEYRLRAARRPRWRDAACLPPRKDTHIAPSMKSMRKRLNSC